MTIESIGYTPTRRRANRLQNNIEDLLSESKSRTVESNENILNENTMMRDISFGSTRSRDEVGKTARRNEDRLNESKLNTFMVSEAFANIVVKALPLDTSFVMENKKMISEKASATYRALEECGVLQEGNYIWNKYQEDITVAVPVLKENSNDLIAVNKILTKTERSVEGLAINVAHIIENKVLSTISDEKILAESRVDLMKYNKKFNGSSLFNAINVRNLKAVSTSDKYIDASKDKLLQISFAETVIDYTILEALNTFELVHFDTDNIVSFVKRK